MQTIIQLVYDGKVHLNPYEVIATLPFLYDKPTNASLTIKGRKCILNEIRDIIDEDGEIKRLFRVHYTF
jgi:hypothetical protein